MGENTIVVDLVGRLFTAFLKQDRETLEAILSDDFTFNSPRDDHINKTEYFERCFPYADQLRSHHIEQLFAEGSEALVRYVAESRDGTRFRNTEYIRTDGHRIKEVDVYFGGNLKEGQR